MQETTERPKRRPQTHTHTERGREAQILLLRRFHVEEGKERETSIPTAAALLTHDVDE